MSFYTLDRDALQEIALTGFEPTTQNHGADAHIPFKQLCMQNDTHLNFMTF